MLLDKAKLRTGGKTSAARAGDQPESLHGEFQSADIVRANKRRTRSRSVGALRGSQKIARREGPGIPAHDRSSPLLSSVNAEVFSKADCCSKRICDKKLRSSRELMVELRPSE